MTTMATVRVNTTQKMILYRDFTIQEVWATEGDVWEWVHNDFGSGNIGQVWETLSDEIEFHE